MYYFFKNVTFPGGFWFNLWNGKGWNQIMSGNGNNNCYFVKLFGLDGKQNYTIYDSPSFCLFYLYKKKVTNY